MLQANTLYTQIYNVAGNTLVTAYHVCHINKSQAIQANGTAGGVAGPNPAVGAPTEQQCVDQVAVDRPTWAGPTQRDVVEFGVNQRPNYNGGANYVVAVFNIRAEYLRKGSGSEGGWCAYPTAPITWLRQENV